MSDHQTPDAGLSGGLMDIYMNSRIHVEVPEAAQQHHQMLTDAAVISSPRQAQHNIPYDASEYTNPIQRPRNNDNANNSNQDDNNKSIAWADANIDIRTPLKKQQNYAYNSNSHSKPHKSIFSKRDKSGLTVSLEVDLALKKDALENITERESVIQRLIQLKYHDPMITKSHVKRLAQELRNITLFCVESIIAWRKSMESSYTSDAAPFLSPNKPNLPPLNDENDDRPTEKKHHLVFRWRDENYLLKMIDDLVFLKEVPQVLETLPNNVRLARNPFLLPHTLDELNLMSSSIKAMDSVELSRCKTAARAILSEEKHHLMEVQTMAAATSATGDNNNNSNSSSSNNNNNNNNNNTSDYNTGINEIQFVSRADSSLYNIDTSLPPPPHLNTRELKVFSKLANPPMVIAMIFACVKILIRSDENDDDDEIPTLNRRMLRNMLRKPMVVVRKLENFNPNAPISGKVLEALYPIVTNPKFSPENIRKISESMGNLAAWVKEVVVEKTIQLGWVDGKPVNSVPVTPFTSVKEQHHTLHHKPRQHNNTSLEESGTFVNVGDNSDSDSSKESHPSLSLSLDKESQYIEMLKKLQHEIFSLKQDLNSQGLIQDTSLNDNDASNNDLSISSPYRQPPRMSTSIIHLSQEKINLDDKELLVKVAYQNNGLELLFTAWDMVTNENLKPTTTPALFCDQITDHSPVELEAMPESFRRDKLRKIVDMLRIESSDKLVLSIDRQVCQGNRKIDGVDYDYKIVRTVDNDGLVVTLHSFDDGNDLESSLDIDPDKTLVLQISDAELELLLAHQPGLFLRSLRKWSSQRAICDWLVTRLSIEVEVVEGNDKIIRHLSVDRTVPVPRNVEKGEVKVGGKTIAHPGYELRARQLDNNIILEAIPNSDDVVDDANSSESTIPQTTENSANATAAGTRPMSRVKIGLAEFQSLGAPENAPEQEQFPLMPPWTGGGRNTPGLSLDSEGIDLGRPARTPLDSLLSRLSWSVKNGQPVLGLNRVVYEETKSVKGTPMLLRASVMEKDIIFQATRLKLKQNNVKRITEGDENDDDDIYEKVGDELVRLITESEATSLLSVNLHDTPQIPENQILYLMQLPNRRELCKMLSDRLKLIKVGGAWRLETLSHREKSLLTIAVDSNHRDSVIGAVDIDDQMNLSEVRKLISREMDEDDLPDSWRFLFRNAPCSKSQEKERMATDLLPVCVLLTKKSRKTRPSSAPSNRDNSTVVSDEDSEFGKPESLFSWDSDDSSKTGGGSVNSKGSKKKRWKKTGRRRKVRKGKKGMASKGYDSHDELIGMGVVGEDIELSGAESDFDFDMSWNDDSNSFSHSTNSNLSVSGGSKKHRNKKAKNKKRAKSLLAKAKAKKEGIATNDTEDEEEKVNDPLKSDNKTTSAPDPPKPPKIKEVKYVPLPVMSLITCTQGSSVIKTQVDCTTFLQRGDTIRIHRPYGLIDWTISSDPKKRFDATAITLADKYVHNKMPEKSPEEIKREEAEKAKREARAAQMAKVMEQTNATIGGDNNNKSPRPVPGRRRPGPAFQGGNSSLPAGLDLPMNLPVGATAMHQIDDDEEEEKKVIEDGTVLEDLRMWKVIREKEDRRPGWRKQYDDGMVPWHNDFTESEQAEEHFRVRIPWGELEQMVRDVHGDQSDRFVLHQQRVNHFGAVTPMKIMHEAYGVLCRWHPMSSAVDNVKWAKFARDMKLFPAKQSSQIDLSFAKRQKERKIDLKGFVACCTDIALIRSPHLIESPNEALMKLLLENVVMLPAVNRLAWKEAKRMAIVAEARRICAQIRLVSNRRGKVNRIEFLNIRNCQILVAKQMRRVISTRNFNKYVGLNEDNRLFRRRHISAVICQKTWRMFYMWRKHEEHKAKVKREEAEEVRKYRKKLRDNRNRREAAVVFKCVRVVQGITSMIMFSRKDNRRQSSDYGIIAKVYLPSTQETFKFVVEEDTLREFIEQALDMDGLSANEMLNAKSLRCLTDRFMVRETGSRPIILFSRRNTTERGILCGKCSKKISGELFVVFSYRSSDDLVFRAYDPRTCAQLRCCIEIKVLRDWLVEEEYRQKRREENEYKCLLDNARRVKQMYSWGEYVDEVELADAIEFLKLHALKEAGVEIKEEVEEEKFERVEGEEGQDDDDEDDGEDGEEEKKGDEEGAIVPMDGEGNLEESLTEKQQLALIESSEPYLMKKDNEDELLEWLLDRLKISRNRRTKRTKLILQYEEDGVQKEAAATKLQGIWRQKKARQKMRLRARKQWEKMWDNENGCYYYINVRTGAIQWTKLSILGSEDLKDPVDEWRKITGEDGNVFYQNPCTGQTSWLSEEEAAKILQRMVRLHQSRDFGTPTMAEVIKALKFQNVAELNFEKDPTRLSNIVNFALLNHCLTGDFAKARECYKLALEKSNTNPVLMRAYAIFTLAAGDAPRTKVFASACDLFKTASLSDPDLSKFHVAQESFFHWAVIVNPKNPIALLNYALLNQCVLGDYELAEKMYQRAIAIDGANQAIIDNFETLEMQRLPGGKYAGKGPSFTVLKRSEVTEERAEWGEWQRMYDRKSPVNTFKHFWYNRLNRTTLFIEPNWNEVWDLRKERSVVTETVESTGWVTYWDEKLGVYFYYNQLECIYQAAEDNGEGAEGEGEW